MKRIIWKVLAGIWVIMGISYCFFPMGFLIQTKLFEILYYISYCWIIYPALFIQELIDEFVPYGVISYSHIAIAWWLIVLLVLTYFIFRKKR